MLKLIKPLHALPGFPGFVTNTTVSLSHTNTGRRLVKRESKGGGIEDWAAGSKRCRAAEIAHLRNKDFLGERVKCNFNTNHIFQVFKKLLFIFYSAEKKEKAWNIFRKPRDQN